MSEQIPTQYPDDWSQLTSEQKREWRFARWRESVRHIPFVDAEAEADYRARLQRLIAVYKVEEPDRVPLSPAIGSLPLREAGLDNHTAIYHPEKAVEAVEAFNRKHAEELDCFAATGYTTIPARALDLLECKMYAHPGHGMPEDAAGFQFIEGEYMRADEYAALLRDPSDFWLRTYFPRVYGVFAPFGQLDPLTDVIEMIQMPLWPLARPDVQALLQRLLDVGKELARYREIMDAEVGRAEAHGHLSTFPAAFAKAPYDTIGDTLRGTRGILMDMLRRTGRRCSKPSMRSRI